jgi:putative transposase
MTRPLRLAVAGSVWHIKVVSSNGQAMFREDADRRHFIALLSRAVEKYKWLLSSYVLMPSYFRLTMELTQPETLSRGLQWFSGCYGQAFNRRHKRVGHIVRSRFEGVMLEKNAYLRRVMRDVVLDAVRSRLCSAPAEYSWSSYRASAGLADEMPWLTRIDSSEEFATFVDADPDDDPFRELQNEIFLGSAVWIAHVRSLAGDRLDVDGIPMNQLRVGLPDMDRVTDAVAAALCMDRKDLSRPRSGRPRMVAAWIGFHEGKLPKSVIAAALGLRNGSAALYLIRRCERELKTNRHVAAAIELCLDTIRRAPTQGEA